MVTSTYSHPAFKVGDGKDIDLNGTTLRNGFIEVDVTNTVVTKAFADTGYTLIGSDYAVLGNAVGGAITLNLPTAVGISGKIYVIKKIDASGNAITVDADGAETIDGALTFSIPGQYDSYTIISDGSNWSII